MAPAGGVEGGSGEPVPTLDVGHARAVQLAHGRDHGVGLNYAPDAGLVAHRDLPEGPGFVPVEGLDLGLEGDLAAQVIAIGHAAEVLQQDRLGGEVLRPVVVGLKAVGVDVVGGVHPATRIGVLEPGAADVGVLVEDLVAHASLAEANAGEQAGHAGADDEDVHLRGAGLEARRFPDRRLGIGLGQAELVAEKVGVALRDLRAGHKAHHPAQGGGGGLVSPAAALAEPIDQGDLRLGQELLLLGIRNTCVAPRQRDIGGGPFGAQPMVLASQVHKRGLQGGLVSGGERPVELGQVDVGHVFPPGSLSDWRHETAGGTGKEGRPDVSWPGAA